MPFADVELLGQTGDADAIYLAALDQAHRSPYEIAAVVPFG